MRLICAPATTRLTPQLARASRNRTLHRISYTSCRYSNKPNKNNAFVLTKQVELQGSYFVQFLSFRMAWERQANDEVTKRTIVSDVHVFQNNNSQLGCSFEMCPPESIQHQVLYVSVHDVFPHSCSETQYVVGKCFLYCKCRIRKIFFNNCFYLVMMENKLY